VVVVERFRADDAQQLLRSLREDCPDLSVVAHGRGRLGYRHVALRSPHTTVGTVMADVAHTIRTAESRPTVRVPVRGSASYRVGRRTLRAEPGTVVFLAPGHEYTARVEPGAMRLLQFDADIILRRLPPGRAGRVRSWAFQSVASRSPRDAFGEVFATIDDLVGGLEATASGAAPALPGAVESRLAAWLTDFLLDVGGLRVTVPAALSLAEDSRRWFEQHITEDVTVARAAHSLGISARWLQRCFTERWGQTPMEFVAARRLANARARLADSDAATVVEEVARQSGFGHPGRFAVRYRRVYGESPSQTVARARYRPRPLQ
jgi:AraC-like DNA-binding protein